MDQQLENCTDPYNNWRSRPVQTAFTHKVDTEKKIKTTNHQDYTFRMCGKSQESVAHVLTGCSAIAETNYLERHSSVLRIFFFFRFFFNPVLLSHWLVLFWSTSASLALFGYLSAFSSHCFDSLSWLCVLPSVLFYLHIMFCSFSPFSRFGTSSSLLSFSSSFWLEYNFFQLLKEFSVLLVTLPGGTRS